MKKIIMFIIFLFLISFNLNATTVVLEFPELDLEGRVNLTSEAMKPYQPCSYFPEPILCTDDSLNLELTILYPVSITFSNLGTMQQISISMTATQEIAKEFKSFIVKKDGVIATFPEIISTNSTLNYVLEIKMDYMGVNSIPENVSFFDVNLSSN